MPILRTVIEQASPLAREVVGSALRTCAVLIGVWLAAVMPVLLWAEHRRAENAASGHLPNMDPGTVVVLAALIAVAPLVSVLLIEAVRCRVVVDRPLSMPSALVLGAAASWPVGATFTVHLLHFGFAGIAVESGLSVLAFYLVRQTWLARKR